MTIRNTAVEAVRSHWSEYLMEAFGLGLFMFAACLVAVVLDHPSSPVHKMIQDTTLRRMVFGAAMGATAILNIYSPWGKRSGAHLNPATTMTFWRLGKVEPWDAIFYSLSQFAGGIAGVLTARLVLGSSLAHPNVNYVATLPGPDGAAVAFAAEVIITFILISVVLRVSNRANLARHTGLFAGSLVMIFITIEAPLSGMSMNPARTLGSALPGGVWTSLWIYFTAPPIGMLLAAELYLRLKGSRGVFCAKLHHYNHKRCIFRCNFPQLLAETGQRSVSNNLKESSGHPARPLETSKSSYFGLRGDISRRPQDTNEPALECRN
jgi:aquaporin Z